MSIRPTQSTTFALVQAGLNFNFNRLAVSQEHIATGKRILRPSDDVLGTAKSLSTRKQMGQLNQFLKSIETGKPNLEASTAALQDVSNVLSEARAIMTQGMNGTLNDADRRSLGEQLDLLVDRLVEVGNSQLGERYVFGGTATDEPPFGYETVGGQRRVVYRGDDGVQRVSIGAGTQVGVNMPGSEIFDLFEYAGAKLSGLTGVQLGTSANQGTGYEELVFRHDGTIGAPGAGITLANGGADDTILQDHVLTVDGAAGTVTLDGGTVFHLPQAGDADFTDFVVKNADGAEVHLDFSGYGGGNTTATLTGSGSVALDGTNYVPLTFTETNLQLLDDETGAVVHIDTTNVNRSGGELVSFGGAVSVFDALQGAANDLKNSPNLDASDFSARMSDRMDELLRNQDNSLRALGTLGARTERLNTSASRLQAMDLNLQGVLSLIEDTDLSKVALELSRAEQTLQLAQMTGSRLIQTSLLNFLR